MISPFADDEATSAIGNLSIENGIDRILISGSVEITRDDGGLERARSLKRLAEKLVARLEDDAKGRRTDVSPAAAQVDTVANPFAR